MESNEKGPAPAQAATAPVVETSDGELNDEQLKTVSGGATTMASVLTNLANMRHEMLKAVAQNLRA